MNKQLSLAGTISKGSLVKLLDICEKNALSGTISVTSGNKKGKFHYEGGEIVKVEVDDKQGEVALDEMLSWTTGSYSIDSKVPLFEDVEALEAEEVLEADTIPEADVKVVSDEKEIESPKDENKRQSEFEAAERAGTLGANSRVDIFGKALYVQTSAKHYRNEIESVTFESGVAISFTEVKYDKSLPLSKVIGLVQETHRKKVAETRLLFGMQAKIKEKNHPQSHDVLGLLFHSKGIYDQAIAEFKRALELDPNSGKYYRHLGQSYLAKERYDHAIEAFKKGLELHPDYPDLHHWLGVVYHKKGMWGEALQEYNSAIRMNPRYAEAYFNLGLLFIEIILQQTKGAGLSDASTTRMKVMKNFEAAAQFDQNYKCESYDKGCILLEKEEWASALQEFLKVKAMVDELKKEDLKHEFYLRFMHDPGGLSIEDTNEFIRGYKEIIDRGARYADLYNDLGITYLVQCRNMFEKAIEEFNKAVEVNPNYDKAVKNLSLSKNEQKGFIILLRAIMK